MLGGGNEHASFHQACGVADLGDIAGDRLDFKAFQVDAAKNDAGPNRRGQDAQVYWRAAVQADATAIDRVADCTFVDQAGRQTAAQRSDYMLAYLLPCGIFATSGAFRPHGTLATC